MKQYRALTTKFWDEMTQQHFMRYFWLSSETLHLIKCNLEVGYIDIHLKGKIRRWLNVKN